MKVIDVSQYEDKATGKQMQKILFEPVDSMAGIQKKMC